MFGFLCQSFRLMSTHLPENRAVFTGDGEFVHKNSLPLKSFGTTGNNKTLIVCGGISFRQGMGQEMLPEHVPMENFCQREEAVRGAEVAQVFSPGKRYGGREVSGMGKTWRQEKAGHGAGKCFFLLGKARSCS